MVLCVLKNIAFPDKQNLKSKEVLGLVQARDAFSLHARPAPIEARSVPLAVAA